MDYIREAIDYLKSYRDLEISMQNMECKIKSINAELGGRAISYKEAPGDTSMELDDVLINKIFQRDQTIQQLKDTRRNFSHVENIIKVFEETHEQDGKLLRLWLIEGKSLHYTAEQLDISERHVYRIKNQALKRFAIQLFGIRVLK